MKVEVLEDVLEELADKLDAYGTCADKEVTDCKYAKNSSTCCRVRFMIEYEKRIREAIDNENKLNQVGLG